MKDMIIAIKQTRLCLCDWDSLLCGIENQQAKSKQVLETEVDLFRVKLQLILFQVAM